MRLREKILIILLSIAIVILARSCAYAGVAGGVTDTNDCQKGDLLIGTGDNTGARSKGTWTNIKDIPELKGEKGDKGDTGERGEQGIKGDTGEQGVQGERGKRGFKGEQGVKGDKGDKGDRGRRGKGGKEGSKGDKPDHKWEDTKLKFEKPKGGWGELVDLKGERGEKGDTGKVDPETLKVINNTRDRSINNSRRLDNHEGRIDELEEMEVNIAPEIKFYRGKNTELSLYGKYDVRHNNVPEVGFRVVVSFGKSWEQKEIEKMNKKVEKLDKLLQKLGGKGTETFVEHTEDGAVITTNEDGLIKIMRRF